MSAQRMKEYFLTQPNVYGYRIASFLSITQDSVYYLTPGRIKPDRRLLAAFSFIRRMAGYELLLDIQPLDYLQYGYCKIEHPEDPEQIDLMISNKRKKGYASVSFMEF